MHAHAFLSTKQNIRIYIFDIPSPGQPHSRTLLRQIPAPAPNVPDTLCLASVQDKTGIPLNLSEGMLFIKKGRQ
jgi:hypothetical protein